MYPRPPPRTFIPFPFRPLSSAYLSNNFLSSPSSSLCNFPSFGSLQRPRPIQRYYLTSFRGSSFYARCYSPSAHLTSHSRHNFVVSLIRAPRRAPAEPRIHCFSCGFTISTSVSFYAPPSVLLGDEITRARQRSSTPDST